jgi:DNA-binding Lrp family transcriptional regulator
LQGLLSEIDNKMLRLILDSDGKIPSHELALKLEVGLSTVQRRRKKLEAQYLIRNFSLDPTKVGWRKIDLFIYTEGGQTMNIGKDLLKYEDVTYAATTIGEHTIDLRVEVFVKDSAILLNLLENVKAMKGVRDVVWSEVVETIGKKNPPNHVLVK